MSERTSNGCVLNRSDDVFSQVDQHTILESCTLSLLELLPSVKCLSPQQALELMKTGRESESIMSFSPFSLLFPYALTQTLPDLYTSPISPSSLLLSPSLKFHILCPSHLLPFLDPSKVVMDKQMFESSHYQRVYQYLRRHIGSLSLNHFSYGDNIEGTPDSCLETMLR